MGSDLNRVMIIGRLGKDPESRILEGGAKCVNFSVATNERWKSKKTGELEERTTWWPVVVFDKLAELCDKGLQRGSTVFVEGCLQEKTWQDRSGVERKSFQIKATDVKFLSPRTEDHPSEGYRAGPPPTGHQRDDVPF